MAETKEETKEDKPKAAPKGYAEGTWRDLAHFTCSRKRCTFDTFDQKAIEAHVAEHRKKGG